MGMGGFRDNGSYLSMHGVDGLGDDPSPACLITREAVRLLNAGVKLTFSRSVDAHSVRSMLGFLGVYDEPRELSRARVEDVVMIWDTIQGQRGKS